MAFFPWTPYRKKATICNSLVLCLMNRVYDDHHEDMMTLIQYIWWSSWGYNDADTFPGSYPHNIWFVWSKTPYRLRYVKMFPMWDVEQGKIGLLTTQPLDAGTILYFIEEHWFKPTLNGRMCYNVLWYNLKIQNLILQNLKVLKIFNSHWHLSLLTSLKLIS